MGRVTKSTRGWGSPSRYFQGPGEIKNLKNYTEKFGTKVFAVIDQFFYETLGTQLQKDYEGSGSVIQTAVFNSEVTAEDIQATADLAKDLNPDVVIGIGGGKTIDTAKAVADIYKAATVIIPTAASTDAPTIALSVLYTKEGEHVGARHYAKNPDIVLVDSDIIAKAPARFLVAGMGDALSTVFEARANGRSDSTNYVNAKEGGYRRTKLGVATAEVCYTTLIENGVKALAAAEKHVITEALEDIIEVNILMSGIGVENNGCSGSHSICEGISALPEDRKTFHGEKVGFGVLCQLMVENVSNELLEEVMHFCGQVGLPLALDDLYIENTPENLKAIAECSMHSYWDTEPFLVTPELVAAAIDAVDQMGRAFRAKHGYPVAYTRR